MPPEMKLPHQLAEQLGVTEQLACFDGGQKYVFIVSCSGIKRVVKMLKGLSPERDDRELNFYHRYSQHTGIPRIQTVLNYNNDIVVVEDYIEGHSLLQHIQHGSYIGQDQAIAGFLKSVCFIMNPLWEEGIVHRDLKPDNILIQPDWTPVVIDFGICKDPVNSTITDTGFQPKTVLYAAPEQLLADKTAISNRTDYFSLGIIAYAMKYGQLPFGTDPDAIIAMIESGKMLYSHSHECFFTEFWERTFQTSVASRPRNTSLFLAGL